MANEKISDPPENQLLLHDQSPIVDVRMNYNDSDTQSSCKDRTEFYANGSLRGGQIQPDKSRNTRRKGRRKSESIIGSLCQLVVTHQIGLAANLLTLLALTHTCFPRARHHTRKFYRLSYYSAASEKYALGWDDSFLVIYWIVVFTGLRAVMLDYVLTPLAQILGLEKRKEKTRFAEQAWLLIYYIGISPLGMFLVYHSDYWLNTRELWTGWPDREMGGLNKWYYLVQFAFYVQQIIVVNIEERRKDYWQMFIHHIITCSLMFTSYGYHQTKVGITILCLMDVVDLLLPLAKVLKYLCFQMACDIAFGAFMLVWVGARHILYLTVCYSIYTEIPQEVTYGCYSGSNTNLKGPLDVPNDFGHLIQPFRDPEGLVCWNNNIKWAFLAALLVLQVILLLWFAMIVRVALKVLKGGEAEDSRSDDEGSDVDEGSQDNERWENVRTCVEPCPIEMPPLEEDVGVEAINLVTYKSSPSRKYRKVGSTASGVHLPSDRKELLGRIGCDKGA